MFKHRGIFRLVVGMGVFFAWSAYAGQQATPTAPLSVKAAESSSRLANRKNEGSKNTAGRTGESKSATAPTGASESSHDLGYRIGVEDELQISVWREPELSVNVVVRPDGMISMPLLNDIPVVGLHPLDLQVSLTDKLKEFVNEPQITVIVRQIRSRKVYLIGQVSRPGYYPLNGTKTVLQLLVEAGGLGLFAKSGSIYVLRTTNGRRVRIWFDYKKVLSGKRGDMELLPGDTVVVP